MKSLLKTFLISYLLVIVILLTQYIAANYRAFIYVQF